MEDPQEQQIDQNQKFWDKISPKNLFSYENVISNLPYLFFLAVICMVYIWNRHSAERHLREMNKLQKELVEYNYKFISGKSELNNKSKQSAVSEMVEPMGLKELTAPPLKIQVNKHEY